MSELRKISDIELESEEKINTLAPLEQIAAYSGILISVLKVVKIFTGKTADAKIDQVIRWLQLNSKSKQ